MKRTHVIDYFSPAPAPGHATKSSSASSSTVAKKAKTDDESLMLSSSSSSSSASPAVDGVEPTSLLITPPFTPNEATAAPQVAMKRRIDKVEEETYRDVTLKPDLKPKILFDSEISPKECSYIIDNDGTLIITCAPFEKYSRKASDVAAPQKVGTKCPGFIFTLNDVKVKVCCLFHQQSRTMLNSYWNKSQWLKCLGCQVVYANVMQNPKASAKRGTGICASGACQVAVVDGKNLCSVHQNEQDTRNALKMAEHREIQKRAAEAADEAEKKRILMESSVYAHNQAGSEKDKKVKELLFELQGRKDGMSTEEYEAKVLSLKQDNRSTDEGRDRNNEIAHKSRQQSIKAQEQIEITRAHTESLQVPQVRSSILAALDSTIVDIMTSDEDFIYCDTEGTKLHTHAETSLWAFYSTKRKVWLSISRSGSLYTIFETNCPKIVADDVGTLARITAFIGAGRIVYFASNNAIDFNRITDWYQLFKVTVPVKWLNAGVDVVGVVFGRKGHPVLSPNYEQATVYRYFWSLEQADAVYISYVSNKIHKVSNFPSVDWNVDIVSSKKPWSDVMILHDIVEVLRVVVR